MIPFGAYITGTNRIELIESAVQGDLLNANTGGSALGQGANTGQFSATSASVLNQSYAHGSGGVDPNGATVMSGAFALNSGGALGGTLAVNDLSFIGAWALGGTYTVDPTGRVTVSVTSLTSGSGAAPPASALTYELYLDGSGNAMVIGADNFQTTQGIAFEQGGTFNLSGDYALSGQGAFIAGTTLAAWSAVGPINVASGSISGFTDYTGAAMPQAKVTLTGTQDATKGLLQLSGLNGNDFTDSTGFGYYPIGGNRLWAFQVDAQGVSLLLIEGITAP
jgi:hypothetical protein